MQANRTLKPILKRLSNHANATQTNNNDNRTFDEIKAARNLEVALYHANIIQQRKDTEFSILTNIETLLDFPYSTNSSADNPSPSDAALFKKLIRPFQPADYDSLIEERNICRKCGYALCPNTNRKDDAKGGFRIFGNGRGAANQFRVGTKAEVEKWCSEACAKRALYIRVQLSETPGWERTGYHNDVELRGEPQLPQTSLAQIAEELRKLDLGNDQAEEGQDAAERKKAADLALERGDRSAAAFGGLVDVKVTEKEIATRQVAPLMNDIDTLEGELEDLHLSLEGYVPQFKYEGRRMQSDDEMDET